MHLAEEQVERFLHGELTPPAATWARDHLAGCAECRDRVSEAENDERWVLDTLRVLDHVQAPLQSTLVVHAARSRGSPAWGRWAAGIFLAAAIAGAAYAAPGSPLPGALARVIQSLVGSDEPAQPIRRWDRVAETPAGIAVWPGERLTIAFGSAQAGDTAVISLSDGQDVVVRARGGRTTFTSDPDRLTIEHQGDPGRFEILIPGAAPLVEVSVGARRILLKQASRLRADVAADTRGRYVIPLVLVP